MQLTEGPGYHHGRPQRNPDGSTQNPSFRPIPAWLGSPGGGPTLAFHLSARRCSQRWRIRAGGQLPRSLRVPVGCLGRPSMDVVGSTPASGPCHPIFCNLPFFLNYEERGDSRARPPHWGGGARLSLRRSPWTRSKVSGARTTWARTRGGSGIPYGRD